MVGIRIIDANFIVKVAEHAWDEWNLAMATQDTNRGVNKVLRRQELCKAVKAVADDAPTIDPETLPIVQELRKKLEQVTAERDAAVNDVQCLLIGKLKACDYCKHNNPYNFDCPMTKQFGYCGYWEWRGAVAENATAGNGGQSND